MFFYSYILKRYYNEPNLIKTKDETEIENILFRNCFNFQEREFMIVLINEMYQCCNVYTSTCSTKNKNTLKKHNRYYILK